MIILRHCIPLQFFFYILVHHFLIGKLLNLNEIDLIKLLSFKKCVLCDRGATEYKKVIKLMMYLGAVREGGGRLHRSTEAGVIQFLLISFTSLVHVTQCITTSCDGFIEMNSIYSGISAFLRGCHQKQEWL